MKVLYYLLIQLYGLLIRMASLFSNKAKEWVHGRVGWKQKLKDALKNNSNPRIWFHCASLGEFEQGRPVLEQLRKDFPNHFILLSFFSPSGYEAKKNETIADYVCYMPLDGPRTSKAFINILNPSLVFFVKYEFWFFYGKELFRRKISFYCLSAIFRPGQIYFKPWGKFFKKILTRYTHLFVQDQSSLELLYRNSIPSVTVSGDTRFDRVLEISSREASFPLIENFCKNKVSFVAGSTWSEDEKVLAAFMQDHPEVKLVIAPHEISETRIRSIESRFKGITKRYSTLEKDVDANCNVLIIDSIGMLSLIYRYGKYTYVGGGFGKGVHNILEAAAYGKPVFFGPHHLKFKEARDLKAMGGGIGIKNGSNLSSAFELLEKEESNYQVLSSKNRKYIEDRKDTTAILMNYLSMNYINR
ncbi:MAG: 3-deoxy-D-manno-octulosonic acid transferase [Bacteroidetes bacterium]|nr:3-deoxy-D-manno-octulosonic acid transferase [Bacteroidota bacterium]